MQKQLTPHKHSELIKVWADNPNTVFQFKSEDSQGWKDIIAPAWIDELDYRVKPKPDIVENVYAYHYNKSLGISKIQSTPSENNLKLTFDGEGKLKAAEVINN